MLGLSRHEISQSTTPFRGVKCWGSSELTQSNLQIYNPLLNSNTTAHKNTYRVYTIYIYMYISIYKLVVSTPLKNIRQIGSFPQFSGWKFQKYLSCHQRCHLSLKAAKEQWRLHKSEERLPIYPREGGRRPDQLGSSRFGKFRGSSGFIDGGRFSVFSPWKASCKFSSVEIRSLGMEDFNLCCSACVCAFVGQQRWCVLLLTLYSDVCDS